MTRIVYTVSENKLVIELSNICRELLKQNSFKHFPDRGWLDRTNRLTFRRRWNIKRDTSKSHLYTSEYTFYDTIEKKIRSVKFYNPYNELLGSGITYLPNDG